MTDQPERICLFDMDGTLCDYDLGLRRCMDLLASPGDPEYKDLHRDDLPGYLKARMDLIRLSTNWWATLPQLELGFDVWEVATKLKYRKMILTQGPKRNAHAWAGKKMWIDQNLGENVDITITRDKGLVYGKVLVDDWPEYIERWLKWRPRGLVIMPANGANRGFKHPQVIRYTGRNLTQVIEAMAKAEPKGKINLS